MSTRWNRSPEDHLPDVRDGLTRLERVILFELHEAERELNGRAVPTATLYGRVVEHINVGVPEFQRVLSRLVGK
ncbi:MAG: hypothetical protein JWN04_4950 [Myxococcaceae bacterium]|nr:hypothetical protein [Myxococcaceae bacterium]